MRLSFLFLSGIVIVGFAEQVDAQQAPGKQALNAVSSVPAQPSPPVVKPTAAPMHPHAAAPVSSAPAPLVSAPQPQAAQTIPVQMPVSQPAQATVTPAPQVAAPVSVAPAPVQAAPVLPPVAAQQPQATVTIPVQIAAPASQQVVQPQPIVAPSPQPQATLTMPVQMPAAPVVRDQAAPKQEVALPQTPEDDTKGISTLDIDEPQGNWLYKRLWWQRAEQQYEKTKGLVDQIMEARMGFFSRRTELDRNILDPFYLDVGLSRGTLEEIIETLVAKSQEKREHGGELKPEERAFLSLIEAEKNNLEQLQKDIQKISDVDHSIDDAVDVLIKQINQARNFERQSWRNFKQIAQELNDKKARELYYGMVTYFQNINDVAGYIQGPLSQHFNQLEALAKEQVNKVQQAMKILKEKGVDFKKQSHQFEEAPKQECAVEIEKVPEQPRGFFARSWAFVSSGLGAVWSGLKSVWNFTIGRFFIAKKQEVVIPEAPQTPLPAQVPAHESEQASGAAKTQEALVPHATIPPMPTASPMSAGQ